MVSCSCYEHSQEGQFQAVREKLRELGLSRKQKFELIDDLFGLEYFLIEYVEYKIEEKIKEHSRHDHRYEWEGDED